MLDLQQPGSSEKHTLAKITLIDFKIFVQWTVFCQLSNTKHMFTKI